MQAALDGHDKDMFKALRSQYLSAVAGPTEIRPPST